jgi:ribulose-phosphate 3-epimerase
MSAKPFDKGGNGVLLSPSILSADPLAVGDAIRSLRGEAEWIHLDVMDGHFVPNLSYGPAMLKALKKAFPAAFLDVHIMVEPVEAFLDMFLADPPDVLTVHAEATPHGVRALQRIREAGVHPGVTLNPGTPVGALQHLLPFADLVLVMTVNPGFGGQKFIPEMLPKFKELVRYRTVHGLRYLIEADGGIGPDNAGLLAAQGCDVLVAGNAVFGQADPAEAARRIKRAASARGADGECESHGG